MTNTNSIFFLFFLAGLAALPPLSIDMGLPALHEIAVTLHTTPAQASLTLSLFIAGLLATPLVYGPLSDRYGRRPILLFGIALYTAGSFAAVLAPSIKLLLIARFLEGAGAGAGTSLGFAIVRDVFVGHTARSKLSHLQMIGSMAPLLAPSIGAAILSIGNWRLIYGLLAAGGVVLLTTITFGYRESHKNINRSGAMFSSVARGYKALFTSRIGLGFALIYGLSFGVQFSYVSASPLVFMGHFGASARLYGIFFAATSCGIMTGAYINSRLAKNGIPGKIPMLAGFAIYLIAITAMIALNLTGHDAMLGIAGLLVLSATGFGLIAANASHGTLQALPQIAGIAGAILASFQMFIGLLSSSIVAAAYGSFGIMAMFLPMLGFALLAIMVYATMIRFEA